MDYKRQRTCCPIKSCQKLLCNLPRHMRIVHKWTDEEAKKVKSLYGIRKPYKFKNQHQFFNRQKKDSHYHKACPIYECRSVVKNLSRHLKQSHCLVQGSDEYKQMLKNAVTVDYMSKSSRNLQVSSSGNVQINSASAVLTSSQLVESSSDDTSYYPSESVSTKTDISNSNSSDQIWNTSKQVVLPNSEDNCSDWIEEVSFNSDTSCSTHVPPLNQHSYLSDLDDFESDTITESDLIMDNETNVQSILSEFLVYLTSPDSGNRDRRSAEQCCFRVRKILSAISSSSNIATLCDRKLLRDVFLKTYCVKKKLHPKTIQTYLKSLEHFLNFVISESVKPFEPLAVESIKCKLIMWKSSYVKPSKIATMSKLEQERKNKITPDDVLKFESSEVVRETIVSLSKALEGKPIKMTQTLYSNVRDLILTEVFIDNGHRAGVLANMTMGEFRKCEATSQSKYFVTVFKHKEARAGPIRVIMSLKLHSWFKTYVKIFRAAITSDTSDQSKVFLTWNGNPFENSGGISNASNALWKKAGMPGRCGSNRFRKAAVSATRESHVCNDKVNKDLANLMGHAKSTADRYYFMEEKLSSAQRAAEKLPEIMRTPMQQLNVGSLSENTTKKNKFSNKDIQTLKLVFASELNGKSIKFHEVKQKLDQNPFFSHLSCRQVYDKLKHLCSEINFEPVNLPTESENVDDKVERMCRDSSIESDENFIPSSITSSKASKKFSPEDVGAFVKIFKPLIDKYVAKRDDINSIIKSNATATSFLRKYSFNTIQNRIKYEIRMKKQKDTD